MNKTADQSRVRDTASLIVAMAAVKAFPDAQIGGYGHSDDGFYVDIFFPSGNLSDAQLPELEAEARSIIAQELPIKATQKDKDEVGDFLVSVNQPFRRDLLLLTKKSKVELAIVGENNFADLVDKRISLFTNTRNGGVVSLLSVAGAYTILGTLPTELQSESIDMNDLTETGPRCARRRVVCHYSPGDYLPHHRYEGSKGLGHECHCLPL